MASPSDTIIIADDEGLPTPEPGGSRLRQGPRRDHSYPDFESTVFGNDGTEPSRKRKRTETEEFRNLDHAFRKLRKALDHELQELRRTNIILREDLRLERNRHQRTREELSQLKKLECKICYMQPDRWVALLCGHMICESCAEHLTTPRKCPLCRALSAGYIECYPFAG